MTMQAEWASAEQRLATEVGVLLLSLDAVARDYARLGLTFDALRAVVDGCSAP